MSLPSTDEVQGKWKQQVGAAKIAWGKLTGLVQERYAITRSVESRGLTLL